MKMYVIAIVLVGILYYVDEDRYSWSFFKEPGEVLLIFVWSCLFSIVPIWIGFYKQKSRFFIWYSMIGFIPILLLIVGCLM